MSSKIVNTVGQAFVDQVTAQKPADPAQLRRDFASFESGLDGSLQGALGKFVREKLSQDPELAWMAQALGAPATSAPANAGAATDQARDVLQNIKALNAQLHDDSVKKGVYLAFSNGERSFELPEVLHALEAGQTVKVATAQYEKASGWSVFGATMLGGSWPVLDGVNMKKLEISKPREITTVGELQTAFFDAKLLG